MAVGDILAVPFISQITYFSSEHFEKNCPNCKMKCDMYVTQYNDLCQLYDHFAQVITMFLLSKVT
jgi:hypothetical protein